MGAVSSLPLPTYEGELGYQPILAVRAQLNVVVADEFHEGKVPAMMDPMAVAKKAFVATVTTVFYYREESPVMKAY